MLQECADQYARLLAERCVSSDPKVAPLARLIRVKIPGELVYINREIFVPPTGWPPWKGSTLTDFDIETRRVVIQVKSGDADYLEEKMKVQIEKSRSVSDKAVVGFAPQFSQERLRRLRTAGCTVYKDAGELLRFIEQQPYPPACSQQQLAA